MASKQVLFWGTRSDVAPGLDRIEAKWPLVYCRCGLYTHPDPPVWRTWREIPNFGLPPRGSTRSDTNFLLLPSAHEIKFRFGETNVGNRWYVDQLLNPRSVTFSPGGASEDGYVFPANPGTCKDEPESVQLYRGLCRELRKGFTKFNGCAVGPEALTLYRSGYRLISMHIHEKPEYDLNPPME